MAVNNPEDLSTGSRQVPFSRVYISSATTSWKCRRRSFPALAGRRGPPSLRLHPEVRAGRKDAGGEIVELRATIDPESLSGATAARRVKGTIHWVSAAHAIDAEYASTIGCSLRRIRRMRARPAHRSQSEFTRDRPRLQGRTCARAGTSVGTLSVRTAGLLQRRSRFACRRSRLQQDGDAEGHVGPIAGRG